jgi:hypothetical protein
LRASVKAVSAGWKKITKLPKAVRFTPDGFLLLKGGVWPASWRLRGCRLRIGHYLVATIAIYGCGKTEQQTVIYFLPRLAIDFDGWVAEAWIGFL